METGDPFNSGIASTIFLEEFDVPLRDSPFAVPPTK
jgi:hypothetical protein